MVQFEFFEQLQLLRVFAKKKQNGEDHEPRLEKQFKSPGNKNVDF